MAPRDLRRALRLAVLALAVAGLSLSAAQVDTGTSTGSDAEDLAQWVEDQEIAKDLLAEFHDPTAMKNWYPILWFWGAPQDLKRAGVGDTIQWIWWDNFPHSVKGVGFGAGKFTGVGGGNNAVSERGFKYELTFNTPGTYSYFDPNYPQMKGVVEVKPLNGTTIYWGEATSYRGASATVKIGGCVTWVWDDNQAHSLTAISAPVGANTAAVFTGAGTGLNSYVGKGFSKKICFPGPMGAWEYMDTMHAQALRGKILVQA